MNLIQGKKILEKYAFTKKTLCKIYNFLFFNRKIIKGKNNQIILPTTFMKKSKIIIKGNNNKIIFGDMCYLINTKISIYGDNNTIIIGEKVYINEGDFYLEDSSNILKIDEHTTFSGNTHLALTEGKKITIGRNCLFSSNVVFRTGDSHSILSNNKRINEAKDITIKNHCWFSQNTTVLKGVTIEENSIIATGAVVTKSPDKSNVIIGGNPSKIIKENINWDHKRL